MARSLTRLKKVVAPLLLAALSACTLPAQEAGAKGLGMGINPARGGVSLPGSPHRYVTLNPRRGDRIDTVAMREEREGGRIDGWLRLRGQYYVPAIAYDLRGGGLSGDGETLVLQRVSSTYPPRRSGFAVLDTTAFQRYPSRPGEHRPRGAVRRIDLPGFYSLHALSPDGRIAYLNRHFVHRRSLGDFELRALDLRSGRLLPGAVKPGGRMIGLPITRLASRDGRWAYTLYDSDPAEDSGAPFMLALDTVEGRVRRIEVPQPVALGRRLMTSLAGLLAPGREPFLAFARTPRRPGNLLLRTGVVGHSRGHPVTLWQYGDPRWSGELLVIGAGEIHPLTGGCPDPSADIYLLPRAPDEPQLASRVIRALDPAVTVRLDPAADDRASMLSLLSRELVRIGRRVRED
jgi:hypothetical protein